MKLNIVVGLLAILITPAIAQDWQAQYLSYSLQPDYPLALVVPEGEHEFAEAFFRNLSGRGVYLGCDNKYAGHSPELAFGQIGNHRFLGPRPQLTITFDNDPPLPITDLSVQPGRYWAPLTYPMLEGFRTADQVLVQTTTGETVIEAPLDGADQAIAVLDCLAAVGV